MKIGNIRAVHPIAPKSPPDWRRTLGQLLIAIDAGLTGYGVGGAAGFHVVRTVLRDLLLWQDAADERCFDVVYSATSQFLCTA